MFLHDANFAPNLELQETEFKNRQAETGRQGAEPCVERKVKMPDHSEMCRRAHEPTVAWTEIDAAGMCASPRPTSRVPALAGAHEDFRSSVHWRNTPFQALLDDDTDDDAIVAELFRQGRFFQEFQTPQNDEEFHVVVFTYWAAARPAAGSL